MSHLFRILKASHRIKSFSEDTRGNFAVLLALMLVPILGLASLGLEKMQASSFRQKLMEIAEAGARAGAETNGKLSDRQRHSETEAQLQKLFALARFKPGDVDVKVNFAPSTVTAGVVVTVTLEANTPPTVSLLSGNGRRIRVAANSGNVVLAASERVVRCHAAATQADFELLQC